MDAQAYSLYLLGEMTFFRAGLYMSLGKFFLDKINRDVCEYYDAYRFGCEKETRNYILLSCDAYR